MSTEICINCKEESTPWEWIAESQGHLCCNCSYLKAEKEICESK